MYTYEIWIRSQQYKSKLPLTYTSTAKLSPGTIVKVDLRGKTTIGIVRREAKPPKGVAMKTIDSVLLDGAHTLPPESLKLLNWLLLYYPTSSGSIAQLFLPTIWPKIISQQKSAIANHTPKKLPKLTPEQSDALITIRSNKGSTLLHGDTGSGKTRIYTELASDMLKVGKSSLLLVPEIGLVPHLYTQLKEIFNPSTIKVFHSGLTVAQRRDVWLEILVSTKPLIVLGPRSALFTPIKNIGLIAVDECHDEGYKQVNAPQYSGLRAASQLARLHNATLVFGSATPAINDYFIAQQKEIPIIRITKNALKEEHSVVKKIIINKKNIVEFSKSRILGTPLIDEIHKQLINKQQSLLFLNRRGSARIIACRLCGWRAACPNCDLPLTFHEDIFTVRCHTCGYSTKTPTTCSDCGNTDIVFLSPGTKGLEKEVAKLFPEAKIARFDGDNLTHERIDKNLLEIQNGKIDIIIGTQILIKGFDIPKLGLVGIIDADSSLTFPDFSTEERTYQLISQAIGRVGRGHLPGVIVVQSFRPDSLLLKQALTKNWDDFYDNQLQLRKKHSFPPFVFLLKLECSRKNRNSAIAATNKLKQLLIDNHPNITILGPTPAFKEKINGTYRWQLVIKSTRRSILLKITDSLPSGWTHELDPTHLL